MRYVSLFSGIEVAHPALQPLSQLHGLSGSLEEQYQERNMKR